MSKVFCPLVTFGASILMCLGSIAHGQQGKGVKNTGGKEWLVRYHLNNPGKSGDIALRLRVSQGTKGSKSLKATLWRYDDKTANKKYKRRTDGGAVVELEGEITKNQEESGKRKREDFELSGKFNDNQGKEHVFTVKGFHYAGRKKADADRDDDQLIIRIHDKVSHSAAATTQPSEPCDEQPPDEDVLTEEDIADPPVYDADDP